MGVQKTGTLLGAGGALRGRDTGSAFQQAGVVGKVCCWSTAFQGSVETEDTPGRMGPHPL